MLKKIKIMICVFFCLNSYLIAQDLELEKIVKEKKVEGTIVIESLNKKKIYVYNEKRADSLLTPASTFKIPNTLIALNEGVVNEDSVIVWDKKIREFTSWNKDQTLQSAFKTSCVWCYKEFASKIGIEKYKNYLEKLDYGNKKIGEDVTDFWLDGSLKISAYGEIKLLKKLYANDLPFKQSDIDILKKIMIDEKNDNYIIRAKTGWDAKYEKQIGWYVGYVETKDDVWFFAINIDIKSKEDLSKRKAIILESLKVKEIIN